MQVQFGINTESPNKITKTFTPALTKTCTIKGSFDTVNPVLELTYLPALVNYNYVYIPELASYYFVKNMTLETGKRLFVTLHIDVLKSFENQILTSYGYATRSSSGSYYLPDNMITRSAKEKWQFRKLGNGLNAENTYILVLGGA